MISIKMRRNKYEFLRVYSRLKACCTDTERAEIEVTEAQYQFGISTGMALPIIASLYLILYFLNSVHTNIGFNIYYVEPINGNANANIILIILIFVIRPLLMVAARFYNHRVHLPLICSCMEAHTGKVCNTEVCRRTNRAMTKSNKKRGKAMYKKAKAKMIKVNESTEIRYGNKINEGSDHVPSSWYCLLSLKY